MDLNPRGALRMKLADQLPHWDGKIVLAALYTIGYFWLIYVLVGPQRPELSGTQKEIATIALAALGPQLGQIFGSIYRTTAADERTAARRDETLQTAITTPGAPAPVLPNGDGQGERTDESSEPLT